jgi:hypothetical protein
VSKVRELRIIAVGALAAVELAVKAAGRAAEKTADALARVAVKIGDEPKGDDRAAP